MIARSRKNFTFWGWLARVGGLVCFPLLPWKIDIDYLLLDLPTYILQRHWKNESYQVAWMDISFLLWAAVDWNPVY